jgi:hypothetical protein
VSVCASSNKMVVTDSLFVVVNLRQIPDCAPRDYHWLGDQ